MKLECCIYMEHGLPLPEYNVKEISNFRFSNNCCSVEFVDKTILSLTEASAIHATTIQNYEYVLGILIHGLECCHKLHGAYVSQKIWIRVVK